VHGQSFNGQKGMGDITSDRSYCVASEVAGNFIVIKKAEFSTEQRKKFGDFLKTACIVVE
jgi:hypothetical protein